MRWLFPLCCLAVACGGKPAVLKPDAPWVAPALRGEAAAGLGALRARARAAEGRLRLDPRDPVATETLCLARLLEATLHCLPERLDAIDQDDPAALPGCARLLGQARDAIGPLLQARSPAAWAALAGGGALRPQSLLPFTEPDAGWLACGAAATVWRALLDPRARAAARPLPAALALIQAAEKLRPGAALGLGLASRGAVRSLAPRALGGLPDEATADLHRALRAAGPLAAWFHALIARYPCTALQRADCAEAALARARKTPAPPLVRAAAERWARWLRDRWALLFPHTPPPSAVL